MSQKRQMLKSDGKNIVLNVYNYFRKEDPRKLQKDVIGSCAAATGISRATIYRIINEKVTTNTLNNPKRKQRTKTVTDIDNFTACAIRQMIYEYQKNEKRQVKIPITNRN